MVDTVKLNERIRDSGLKREFIADKLGITSTSLSYKVCGRTEFKVSESLQLCKLIGVQSMDEMTELFFAKQVNSGLTGENSCRK